MPDYIQLINHCYTPKWRNLTCTKKLQGRINPGYSALEPRYFWWYNLCNCTIKINPIFKVSLSLGLGFAEEHLRWKDWISNSAEMMAIIMKLVHEALESFPNHKYRSDLCLASILFQPSWCQQLIFHHFEVKLAVKPYFTVREHNRRWSSIFPRRKIVQVQIRVERYEARFPKTSSNAVIDKNVLWCTSC